jgi:hypothetical protein
MARTYRPGRACPTVTLPLIPDFRVPMSGIAPIPSGFPPGPDVPGNPDIRGKMTHTRHSLVGNSCWFKSGGDRGETRSNIVGPPAIGEIE